MKDGESLHLLPLIDCTKVDEDSDFDHIKNKSRRRDVKELTKLRDDKDAKTKNKDFSLP